MNIAAPTLSPLFRSDTQAEILSRLVLNPDISFTTADLARVSHAPYATAHREVQRLVDSRLLLVERVGQAIRMRVDTNNPVYAPLAEILRLSYGPASVLPRVLTGIPGIQDVYLYGSWAARRAGEPGDAPGDIDVLVVGSPPRSAIAEASGIAERTLGREVNIRIVSPATWKERSDLFVRTVLEQPLYHLDIEQERA